MTRLPSIWSLSITFCHSSLSAWGKTFTPTWDFKLHGSSLTSQQEALMMSKQLSSMALYPSWYHFCSKINLELLIKPSGLSETWLETLPQWGIKLLMTVELIQSYTLSTIQPIEATLFKRHGLFPTFVEEILSQTMRKYTKQFPFYARLSPWTSLTNKICPIVSGQYLTPFKVLKIEWINSFKVKPSNKLFNIQRILFSQSQLLLYALWAQYQQEMSPKHRSYWIRTFWKSLKNFWRVKSHWWEGKYAGFCRILLQEQDIKWISCWIERT